MKAPARRLAAAAALAVLAAAALLAAAEGGELLSAWLSARRAPLPAPGSFELYAVGDSTAFGEPYGPSVNLAALTARALGGRLGGRPIAPVLVAEPGATARAQLLALRRKTAFRDPKRPGAALIYVGHNDRTLFDTPASLLSAPAAWLERRSLAAAQLEETLARALLLVPHRDLPQYEADMAALADAAARAGLTPVLMTCASNLADIDPRPLEGDGLSREAARAALEKGAALERSDPPAARRLYLGLAARSPGLAAYARYRLGVLARARGRWDEARRLFAQAAQDDRLDRFGRATPAQNDAVRRLAAARGLPLVDAAALFQAASPHGLVGDELFSDGHHPNLRGRWLLAGGAARALAARLGATLAPAPRGEAARLAEAGLSPSDRERALVYSGKWWLASAADDLAPGLRLRRARRRFEEALALSPQDEQACFGLALLRLNERTGWLGDPAALAWFAKRGIEPFVSDDYAKLSARSRREIGRRFERAGLPVPRCR